MSLSTQKNSGSCFLLAAFDELMEGVIPVAFHLAFAIFLAQSNCILQLCYHFTVSLNLMTLTFPVPIPDEEKIKLNFYFHTLWCLRRFYEGLKSESVKIKT